MIIQFECMSADCIASDYIRTPFSLLPAIGAVLAVLTWRRYDLKTSDVELMAKFNNGEIDLESCEAALSRLYPRSAR